MTNAQRWFLCAGLFLLSFVLNLQLGKWMDWHYRPLNSVSVVVGLFIPGIMVLAAGYLAIGNKKSSKSMGNNVEAHNSSRILRGRKVAYSVLIIGIALNAVLARFIEDKYLPNAAHERFLDDNTVAAHMLPIPKYDREAGIGEDAFIIGETIGMVTTITVAAFIVVEVAFQLLHYVIGLSILPLWRACAITLLCSLIISVSQYSRLHEHRQILQSGNTVTAVPAQGRITRQNERETISEHYENVARIDSMTRTNEYRTHVGGEDGSSGLVNLNSASAEELDAVNGIGMATAKKIVAHREAYGPFTSVDQLKDAGVENIVINKIRDLVACGPAGAASGSTASQTIYGASTSSSGKMNINGATLEQIDALPQISPRVAQAILDARNALPMRRFTSWEQVDAVVGVGVSVLSVLKEHMIISYQIRTEPTVARNVTSEPLAVRTAPTDVGTQENIDVRQISNVAYFGGVLGANRQVAQLSTPEAGDGLVYMVRLGNNIPGTNIRVERIHPYYVVLSREGYDTTSVPLINAVSLGGSRSY